MSFPKPLYITAQSNFCEHSHQAFRLTDLLLIARALDRREGEDAGSIRGRGFVTADAVYLPTEKAMIRIALSLGKIDLQGVDKARDKAKDILAATQPAELSQHALEPAKQAAKA